MISNARVSAESITEIALPNAIGKAQDGSAGVTLSFELGDGAINLIRAL